MKTIYFDMDGTIADLYGVDNWLYFLTNEDTLPYEVAKPLLRFSTFAYYLNKLQMNGYRIGIISWLSKNGNDNYNKEVTRIKQKWLRQHLPSVIFDEIIIVPYGTPKENYANDFDILFDDEERNRNNWCGIAYDVNNIMEILKNLLINN